MVKKAPKASVAAPAAAAPAWRLPLAIFGLALLLRLLFWQATDDRAWPHSVYYQGDALVWLDYALALQRELPFEQGLPLRPPGNGYLVAALWDGTPAGIPRLKFLWCVMGAAAMAWLARTLERSFGPKVAWPAGLLLASATPLMVLSTSLNNETPYLLLVAALLALQVDLRPAEGRPAPATWRLAAWGGVNALACLFRAEHLLFFLLADALLAFEWWRSAQGLRWQVVGRRLAWVLSAWALVLTPWHLKAWQATRDFNRLEPQLPHATAQAMAAIEAQTAGLPWDAEAQRRRDALPAASRRTLANFVALTVQHRGGTAISGTDFAVLEEAFGVIPERLGEFPLLVIYGPLNFYLANNALSDGYFGRQALETKPPLRGGADRFPSFLVAGLPPPDLALTYPPHLHIVNHGYALGFAWIAENPATFAGLAAKRLALFWRGAAGGLGGCQVPGGLSGERRRVDLVTADHPAATAWRLLWAALFLVGVVVLGRKRESWPWLALFATQLIANLFFFGYARLGALAAPAVMALGVAGLVHGLEARDRLPSGKNAARALIAAAALLVVLEAARTFVDPPTPALDGREIRAGDHWPVDQHETRRLELR